MEKKIPFSIISKNDGLDVEDFHAWFPYTKRQAGMALYFTFKSKKNDRRS